MATIDTTPRDDELDEKPLPLEVGVERRDDGWTVRAPLRTEVIQIQKVVAPYQRVLVRARLAEELERLSGVVRHEELSIQTEGDLEAEHVNVGTNQAPPT